ncbi:MAG: hypothetical protein ACLFQR_05235 [Desulfovibrionales bacterium]
MMKTTKIKFSSQADPDVLGAVKEIAEKEGKNLQVLLDEAMRDLIEKRHAGKPRRHVLEAFGESLADFDQLYRELADK